ncbi:hypothetical protein QFC20_001174 [Naganishia adeliensis]|uniref:Uncharacterized protein n=1 Tax=Naganishia adeliensis TaxID=92952 RepID=A0ACC2WVZ3_9TREE|nr:hypothetical protein QFC20_001174 [Naganishia adeliensis]
MTSPAPSKISTSLTETLTRISADLEAEQQLKESIKESLQPLDTLSRSVTALINRAHSTPADQLEALAEQTIEQVRSASAQWQVVADKIPKGEYHRYAYQPSFILKPLVTATTLAYFLLHDDLLPLPLAAEIIGIKSEWEDRLQLSPDDYLQGVIGASNELARLAMNAVTLRNFSLPLRIATFEKDLFAGFSILNLRNDALRRRFDSLKYDVKRCEDVVYDITLRNLAPPPAGQ